MKINVILIYLSSCCFGRGNSEEYDLGNPFTYSFTEHNESSLRLSHRMNNRQVFDIVQAYSPPIPLIELKFTRLYKFDNGSSLEFYVNDKKNKGIDIKIRQSSIQHESSKQTVHSYEEGANGTFECDRTYRKLDSVHWLRVNDQYVVQDVKTLKDLTPIPLAYNKILTQDDDGSKLICIFFKCEEHNNSCSCERELVQEIELSLKTTGNVNNTNVGSNKPPYEPDTNIRTLLTWFGGVSGVVVILIIIVTGVVCWKRKILNKKKKEPQYTEISFSDTASRPRAPLNTEKIMYSQITGVLISDANAINTKETIRAE